jgi:Coenzyme PQQ synthesis protein D (PqqD)
MLALRPPCGVFPKMFNCADQKQTADFLEFGMADESTVPVPRDDFTSEVMDGEHLIYSHGMKKAIYLNDSAAVIWQLCDGRRCVREIVDMLAEAYPDQRDELYNDTIEAVELLHREGAVRFAQPASN